MTGGSDASKLERARSLANRALFTVKLQHRRLRTKEPEDKVFLFRWWADLDFLIVTLRRLRRAAGMAAKVPTAAGDLNKAIITFDQAIPGLATMRNVGEHFDDYAVDSPTRHHRNVGRGQLQVAAWDGTTFTWLGHDLNIDDALAAAKQLFRAIKSADANYAASHVVQTVVQGRPMQG